MKIKLTDENRDKVETAFNQANGRAQANTLRAFVAYEVAKEAEQMLEARGIPKSRRKGAAAFYSPSGPARAYKYAMTTTCLRIERGAEGWHLVDVTRIGIRAGHNGGTRLIITKPQVEIITKQALDGLIIAA
ncbi:hypothetical protein [Rhizobium leguminosarum]|uniref:hypothetical protein n=1 Tax=Rhizobium leguminosarum TaxID=384 RepID=UPI0010314763|nr:hypothetical protein [Rhizobium leguminosarum]TBG52640.1 hypothetical protein ELG74_36725 [Rhizobium leguminosarum]